ELKATFTPVAEQLARNEAKIVEELNNVQGTAVELGGYYRPDQEQVSRVMRPSAIFNTIIDGIR
ncbi:MAG: NADP-dependent isocitrate dehydrogenase, partial [Thioalkalispiraceae bacterium]